MCPHTGAGENWKLRRQINGAGRNYDSFRKTLTSTLRGGGVVQKMRPFFGIGLCAPYFRPRGMKTDKWELNTCANKSAAQEGEIQPLPASLLRSYGARGEGVFKKRARCFGIGFCTAFSHSAEANRTQ